jgi:hypothetical protein
MAARLLHYLKRAGLEHLNGLYVDVAVSNQHVVFSEIPNPPVLRVRGPYRNIFLKASQQLACAQPKFSQDTTQKSS